MFETRTQIRREATLKALAESRQEGREDGIRIGEERGEKRGIRIGEERGEERGERRSAERIRAELVARGIELSPKDEEEIFGSNGHKP